MNIRISIQDPYRDNYSRGYNIDSYNRGFHIDGYNRDSYNIHHRALRDGVSGDQTANTLCPSTCTGQKRDTEQPRPIYW